MSTEEVKIILSFVAAVLVPITGAVGAIISRSSTQRQIGAIELKKAKLELISKSLLVGKEVSNILTTNTNPHGSVPMRPIAHSD